jgi:hypothetical protein
VEKNYFNGVNEADFFARIADMVTHRYELNADKSLRDVYQLNANFLDTHSDADFVTRNRDKILVVLADRQKFEKLVELFVNRAIEFTYASNQFIQLDSKEEARLRRIYRLYLHQIVQILTESSSEVDISAGMARLVKTHFQDLRTNISRFFDPETSGTEQANVILQKVVCAEYTPEMQLEILNVQVEALQEPVMDLGCGKSGGLVAYLRQKGIRAIGVDRLVDPSPNLIQSDWLEYNFVPGQWGTVISHMAFSNHFFFQHLYQHGSIETYARQYMAILQALKIGGSFYYAPGLPFIERFLSLDIYQATRKQIVGSLFACRVERIV